MKRKKPASWNRLMNMSDASWQRHRDLWLEERAVEELEGTDILPLWAAILAIGIGIGLTVVVFWSG
jgi:hypothetical protein